jgi:hypothetical protein
LKFRDHPLTTLGTGAKPWPPVWITASENRTTGEIGILQDVSIGVLIDTTLFLFIDYQASRYVGSLSFDDPIACQKIYNLLKLNVGRSIEEIGDLAVRGEMFLARVKSGTQHGTHTDETRPRILTRA